MAHTIFLQKTITHCIAVFKTILLVLLLCRSYSETIAQDTLGVLTPAVIETAAENIPKEKKKFKLKNYLKEGYPDPKKAITLAILPGLGQIYNKKYWKLPLVYGALGGVVYFIDFNTKRYEIYRQLYDAKTNDQSVYEDTLPNYPASAVKSQRDAYDKNRQLSWIGVFGFYLISAGDAFVDAHLKDFNVSDDISLQPNIQTPTLQPTTYGLSLKIKLSK